MEVISSRERTKAHEESLSWLWERGVLLLPTDTLYALAAWGVDDASVEKIYAIKGRDPQKPMHALVSDIDMASFYGYVDDSVRYLLGTLPKGKLTAIVNKRPEFDSGILRGIDSFGFRIPDDDFLTDLIAEFGMPLTATSANLSGTISERSVDAIIRQLGSRAALVDLAIDGGKIPERKPSTVIDVTSGELRILREGAVPAADIRTVTRP